MRQTCRAGQVAYCLITLAACLTGGCGTRDPTLDPIRRDSAGVIVVEYPAALLRQLSYSLPRWRLDAASLSIGQAAGDSAYMLTAVASGLRQSDGGIILALRQPSRLRAYDSGGRHLRSIGRAGDGPGEFRNLYRLWRYRADSLAAFDIANDRVTIYDSELRRAREFQMSPSRDEYGTTVVGPFDDGRFLAFESEYATPSLPHGAHRMRGRVALRGDQGEHLGEIARLPGSEWMYHADARALFGRPFGATSAIAVRGMRAWMTAADSFDVGRYDDEGALQLRLRLGGFPEQLTPAEIEAYIQSQIRSYEDAGRTDRVPDLRRRLEETDFPEYKPALQSLALDADQNLWARIHGPPSDSVRYLVFSSEGNIRAAVTLSPGAAVLDIGRDWLLLRTVDDLDVERVALHPLRK